MRIALVAVLLSCASITLAQDVQQQRNQRAYPPEMPGARAEAYKTVDDTKLHLYFYEPKQADQPAAGNGRPAIVFFFGGGWQAGSPQQFVRQCQYLASRGMVAIAADYRVASRHQAKVVDCVRDAKSAIRYVRANAERLGIDPKRIVAAGGSAGGHLAAATGTLTGFDEEGEDTSVSSRPDATLLYNPALVLAPVEGVQLNEERLQRVAPRLGAEPRELSPYHHIAKGVPPTAIFHGTDDKTVPHASVAAFAKAMQAAGNRCELHSYEGQGHGFFNSGRGDGKMFIETLADADRFLESLGYVQGEPTIGDAEKNQKR
jgi:acetyl esterase/lipase